MGTTLIGREDHLFIQQIGTQSLFIGLMCSATTTGLATGIWMITSLSDQSWTCLMQVSFLHMRSMQSYVLTTLSSALRIMVKNCEYFKKFSKIVPAHIPHQYSKEMRKQSQVVSLYTRELSKQQRWLNKCNSF